MEKSYLKKLKQGGFKQKTVFFLTNLAFFSIIQAQLIKTVSGFQMNFS